MRGKHEPESAPITGTLNNVVAAREQRLRAYYKTLFQVWGRQHWWPARTRFEVIVGAYLTQNTAWTSAERALRSLRTAKVLTVQSISSTPLRRLGSLIRSAGYFRQKARSLKTFVAYLNERYGGSLTRMFNQPTAKLREELLALNGVGPETADSILLYAGQHPVFVVDAYTRRILDRHNILPANAPYEEIRELFERALAEVQWEDAHSTRKGEARASDLMSSAMSSPIHGAAHLPSTMSLAKRSHRVQVYNEMHGLIVGVGKHFCAKSQPKCDQCPLRIFLPGVQ